MYRLKAIHSIVNFLFLLSLPEHPASSIFKKKHMITCFTVLKILSVHCKKKKEKKTFCIWFGEKKPLRRCGIAMYYLSFFDMDKTDLRNPSGHVCSVHKESKDCQKVNRQYIMLSSTGQELAFVNAGQFVVSAPLSALKVRRLWNPPDKNLRVIILNCVPFHERTREGKKRWKSKWTRMYDLEINKYIKNHCTSTVTDIVFVHTKRTYMHLKTRGKWNYVYNIL